MKGFMNVQVFPNKHMLAQEEIDVVVAALEEMRCFYGGFPNKGTIILDGQQKGQDAQCVMRVNLERGTYDFEQVMEGFPARTSDALAEESIDAILDWPEKPAYGYVAQARNFGEMETGIYVYGAGKAMVLNTTRGRFLMSAQLAQEIGDGRIVELRDESIAMMKGMAMVLARIRPEDEVLQYSAKKLMQGVTEIELALQKDLDCFFEKEHIPELQTWKKWHEAAMNSGERLALFFG